MFTLINKDGNKKWFKLLMKVNPYSFTLRNHRLKGPAIEHADGTKEWWKKGKRHRSQKMPVIEYSNGTKEWYSFVSQRLNRGFDLPAVEYSNGDKEWWQHGVRHRLTGPAVIYGNKKYWFINGELTCIN